MAFNGILIGASIFFGLGFLGIGMASGVLLVLAIDVALIIIRSVATGRSKEMVKNIETFGEGFSEVGGATVKTAVKTAKNIVTDGAIEIHTQSKQIYNDIGGREGLKRGAEAIGRITEEAALFGITVAMEGTKAVAHVTQETLDNFNKKRNDKRLSAVKHEALEDIYENVDFKVIDGDNGEGA
jgi:ribosomal protein L20A (L18A)